MARRKCRRGGLDGGPPEDIPWFWIAIDMLGCPTFAALSITARRILDLLLIEYLCHAGTENGNLAATYRQLEAHGASKADIRKGFAELELCGFIQKTFQGFCIGNGGEPTRYGLTWFPTMRKSPEATVATDDWREKMAELRRSGINDVRGVRAWLKNELKPHARGRKKKGGSVDIEGAPQMRGEDRLQVRGDTLGNIVALTPHMRGGRGNK